VAGEFRSSGWQIIFLKRTNCYPILSLDLAASMLLLRYLASIEDSLFQILCLLITVPKFQKNLVEFFLLARWYQWNQLFYFKNNCLIVVSVKLLIHVASDNTNYFLCFDQKNIKNYFIKEKLCLWFQPAGKLVLIFLAFTKEGLETNRISSSFPYGISC